MFDINQIDQFFPMDSYRPGQRTVIVKILEAFNSGLKYVFAECPTGSGKSAIGFTIAQMMSSAYYLAPQKFLQDQLMGDFGDNGIHTGGKKPMIDLKGRGTYPCNYWERALADRDFFWGEEEDQRERYAALAAAGHGCDRGECKRQEESKLKYCVNNEGTYCPYFKRMYQAQGAHLCLMNFHSFLFQTSVAFNFGKRQLLILDEGHNTEDVLLRFVELRLSDRHFQSMGVRFPQLDTVDEYIEFFQNIELEDKIRAKVIEAMSALDSRAEEEWKNQLLRYKILLEADPEQWVCIWEESEAGTSRTVTLKPIFVDSFAQKYFFSKVDFVLIMSATILSQPVMCESLGIPPQESKLIRLGSNFPAKNRPLYYKPSGSMSFGHKGETLPQLIMDVDAICRKHGKERGIIHTHSFEICQKLMENCSAEVRSRFLFQQEFEGNKHAMLQKHKTISNSILIAPAMHEGLDLKDDLGRFQILCKVPYPSKNDPQIAARMNAPGGGEYYNWRAATKLVQSYGRIYRHEKDFGATYILDSDFKRFVQNVRYMLPTWFTSAIVWE